MIIIRTTVAHDLPILAAIYAETHRAHNTGERWTRDAAHKLLAYHLHQQPDLCFTAEYEGNIVGAIVARVSPWWDGNRLKGGELFIHPDFEREGVGTRLAEVLLQTAVEKYSIHTWDVPAVTGQLQQDAWFRGLGFTEPEERKILTGNLLDALSLIESREVEKDQF